MIFIPEDIKAYKVYQRREGFDMNFLIKHYYHCYYIIITICLLLTCFTSCNKQKNNQALAHTYFKMGFLEISEDPDTIDSCKKALINIDRALAYYEKPEYYAFKATLLFRLSEYDESEKCFKKAFSLSPDKKLCTEIMNNYACLLAQGGQKEKAEQMWHKLKQDVFYATPEVAWVNLGKLCISSGDFTKAQEMFYKAVEICPSYVDAHFYLAKVAAKLGDSSLVKKEYDILLALEGGQKS